MELPHERRLVPEQLGREQVAEEMVDAVPPLLVVDRLEEEILVARLNEPHRRVVAVEHRVTQRGAQSIEDRGPGEERDLLSRQGVEHLGAEVLREVRVAAARRDG